VPPPWFSSSAYWCRHPRRGHKRPRDLIEQLIGILFLGQRRRQKLHDGRVMELLSQILGRCALPFRGAIDWIRWCALDGIDAFRSTCHTIKRQQPRKVARKTIYRWVRFASGLVRRI
jgi:hypothetical protein